MSDLTTSEPMLPEPPRGDRWIVGTVLASVLLHAGVLAFLVWQPLPEIAEAAPPPAIDVELVRPPETASASEPPASEAPSEEDDASEAAPAGTTSAEQPSEQAASAPSAAEAAAQEMPSATETPETASEVSAAATSSSSEPDVSAASEGGSVDATKVAPVPLARPRVRGLTAPSDAPEEAAPALATDSSEVAAATDSDASTAELDAAILELGPPRSAERFYLEAMLSAPSMARARDVIKTLPHDKRLAQTCNIEALAQIGNAGEGFAPDAVMAEAYALAEVTGTRLVADGGIFRSEDKWYGVAFDCTLSDDLTSVTAFSYRLGADVTEAVLARLGNN